MPTRPAPPLGISADTADDIIVDPSRNKNGEDASLNKSSSNTARRTHKKRARRTVACYECQARKIKCDGMRPSCTACVTRYGTNTGCHYQSDPLPTHQYRLPSGDVLPRHALLAQLVPTKYIPILEKKIQEIESNHESTSATSTSALPGLPGSRTQTPTNIGALASETELVTPTAPGSGTDGYSANDEISQSEARDGLDGMGNLGPMQPGPTFRVGGSSSTASFLQQLRSAVEERAQTPRDDLDPTAQTFYHRSHKSHRGSANRRHRQALLEQLCVLPPRHRADTMIDFFWIQGIRLYPFLVKSSFTTAYQALWTGNAASTEQILIYCSLNVIFAIASQFSHDIPLEMRESTAELYFERAMQLLHLEVFSVGSLQLVQTILLMGMYLQSTDEAHRCWVLIGVAIRVAQGLRLHLPETTAGMKCQSERELARRVWHGCILMDRIVSTTLGQPMMIGPVMSRSVPLPAAIDDEFLSSEPGIDAIQPPNIPSKIDFYVQSLKLYIILEEILNGFYSSGVSDEVVSRNYRSTKEGLDELDCNLILRIDRSLTQWFQDIPEHLVWRPKHARGDADELFVRQSNVLHLRYLHVQILLFRPALSRLLLLSPRMHTGGNPFLELSLNQATTVPFSRKCVSAAQQIIEITYSYQRNDGSFEPLPAWWYKVFYVYSAATVLVAARMDPLRDDDSNNSIEESWSHCLEILNGHAQISKSALCCVTALEFLDRHMLAEQGQRDATQQQNFQMQGYSTGPHQPVHGTLPDVSAFHDVGSDSMNTTATANGGDLFYSMGTPDLAWLHTVPMDLQNFEMNDIFGTAFL